MSVSDKKRHGESDVELPNSLPVKTLLECHPDFNPLVLTPSGHPVPVMTRNADLYEGDDRFARHKAKYLRARQADKDPLYYAARLACARSPELGTTQINRLAGACFVAEPKLVPAEGAPEYWTKLNTDADGTGRDLAAILYHAALQFNVFRRAYLAVDFPQSGQAARSLGDALTATGGARAKADAYITSLSCGVVDDWSDDADGNPVWFRLHTVEYPRGGPAKAAQELHRWSYFDAAGRTDFTATKELGKDWPEKAEATAGETETYDYGGRLPIIRIEVPAGMCAMTLMAPLLLEYFNNRAALQFLYDTNCYQMPVINSNRDIKSLFVSELSAWKLDPGDSASFLAPAGTPFEQLRTQCEKIKEDIYQAVGNAVELSAAKEGYGRQTGAAVESKQVAFSLNINTLRAILKDAVEKCIELIKVVRKEETEIKVYGFTDEDTENIENEKPLEINGAVAQGIISLMQSSIITLPEARRRLGFTDEPRPEEVKATQEAKKDFQETETTAGAPPRAETGPQIQEERASARPAQTAKR